MTIFLILFLFFLTLNVNAASTSLTNFEVSNGVLLYPFSASNNVYTIRLEEDAEQVMFTYQLEDETAHIEIVDNIFEDNQENVMLLKITNEEQKESEVYTFYLEKEETAATLNLDSTANTLTIPKKERSPFLVPILFLSCAGINSILFYFLIVRFLKKSPKKKSST